MPDLSLFKPICETLDISINELLSGEKITNNYEKKLEENIINTINYTNKAIHKKDNAIGIILISFGIIISLTAMSIFKSESSWGSVYSVLGVIISLIGVSRFTKRLSYVKRLLFNFGYFIIFICLLFLIDYIGVVNLKQAPRFALNKTNLEWILYYDTPFYDVIRCEVGSKVESWNVEKNKKRSEEDITNYCIEIARKDFYASIKDAYKTSYVTISKLVDFLEPNEEYEYGMTIDVTGNKNQIVKVITKKEEIAKILEILKNAKPIFGPVNLPGYTYLFQLGDETDQILEFRMNELYDGKRTYSIGFTKEDKEALDNLIREL